MALDSDGRLQELLADLAKKNIIPKLLLHSCCAPCSSYCLSYLMEHFDITVYYYNPNIYPEDEYLKRAAEQKRLADILNKSEFIKYDSCGKEIIKKRKHEIKLITAGYNHGDFLDAVKGLEDEEEGGLRCNECFRLRLEAAYDHAKNNGFDFFGTTLSVSPHKNSVLLNEIGTSFTDAFKTPAFLISDFKKKDGYKISIELSKRFDLYRQTYCGCEFSLNNL